MRKGVHVIATKRIVVIGAGMGGLAAAAELAIDGMAVTVLDRAPGPGGKLRQISVGGHAVDAGPTVLTMQESIEELFRRAGRSLTDFVAMRPSTTLARHLWAGPQQLDLYADRARSAEAIAAFASPRDAAGYLELCADAERAFNWLHAPLLRGKAPEDGFDIAFKVGLLRAFKLKRRTFWAAVSNRVQDPRLRQLFGHYATVNGTSPFLAPSAALLLAHVRQRPWFVEGGLSAIAAAVAGLAEAYGATFRFNTAVREIMVANGRATGVRLENGEMLPADAVVMNGEPGALATGLLGAAAKKAAKPLKFPQRSLSALTWAVSARITGDTRLLRHTYFFSRDYKQEFQLIDEGRPPMEPTVYIYAQDRGEDDGTPVPSGAERLLMLVNAPASGDRRSFSQVEIDQCMSGTLGLLNRCGVQMQAAAQPVMTSPAVFHRLYPASGGALYGPLLRGWRGALLRPGARSRIRGLYLAGGSTHPGPGLAMATLAGRQAAASIVADLAPTRRGLSRLFGAGTPPAR